MKITDMRIHPIAIADPPLRNSYGLHAPYALRTILELRSADGIVGIAETYGGDGPAEALEALRTRVVGADPYRLTGALIDLVDGEGAGADRSQTMLVPGENPLDASTRTFAGLETACLDLVGKTIGQPVCDLIGGRVRDRVRFSAYPFYKHAGGGDGDDVREDEYGEALTPEDLVRQMRWEFGPEVPLRIDPNSAWTVETSVRVGEALAEDLSGGGYLEDPAVGLDGMADVRRRLLQKGIDTPLASNVAVTSFGDH